MSEAYDPAVNSERQYALWLRAAREIRIRSGLLEPDPNKPEELRWRDEGPRSVSELEAVRE